jgi:hypothetical protein
VTAAGALAAALNSPRKLALGPDGSLYAADRANRRVRKVTPDGRIVTVLGTPGRKHSPSPSEMERGLGGEAQ